MHNYLRAIGFNQLKTNTDVDNFIFNEVVCEKNKTAEFAAEGGSMIREYRLKVGEGIGGCAITESFRSGRQNMSYFPYLNNPDDLENSGALFPQGLQPDLDRHRLHADFERDDHCAGLRF